MDASPAQTAALHPKSLHSQLRYKTLEEAQFCWPRIGPATVRLNHAQLLALVDGLDWKKVRPVVVKRPQSMG
jgi:transposase